VLLFPSLGEPLGNVKESVYVLLSDGARVPRCLVSNSMENVSLFRYIAWPPVGSIIAEIDPTSLSFYSPNRSFILSAAGQWAIFM